ncbi:MAG: polysaccharide biosynthesis tyrosine autokinase [Deltaproteobacteria bacterium]|nr:polysaccharide biosynthesis tyrosine autokinase [Kofleriaceae bacterium]
MSAPASPPTAARNPDAADDVAISETLLRYLAVLRRRYRLLLAVLVAGVTLSVLYTMRQPKIYAATSTVVVNPQAPRVFGDNQDVIELGAGSYWSNQEYYNTQVNIMTGFPLARSTVVKEIGGVPIFEKLAPAAQYPRLSEKERIDLAAEVLKGMTSAAQARESRVVGVTVTSMDPELAKQLANEQVKSYIAATLAKRTRGADKSSKFLSTELDAAERTLGETEQQLYKFKDEHDIISVSLEDRQNIVANDIQRYSAALGDAKVKRIELGELRKRALALKGEEVLESPVFALASNAASVEALKASYLTEKQRLLELEGDFGPKSSKHVQQQKKVDDLYAQLQGESRRAMRELEERYQAATGAEVAFGNELTRLKKEALALGPLQVEYNRLLRQQKVDEDNYKRLLGRLHSSDQESRNEQINVDEHEAARAAFLVSPRLKVNIAIAVMLSLLAGIGLVFLLDYLDRTIKSAEEIEQLVRAPLLGVIPVVAEVPNGDDPKSQKARDLYVFTNPTSRAAECCRSIRTNILFSAADRQMKTITVSSPRPREGKTTSTIYMGTTMAQSGQRVLLIDTDLRRPRLHKSLEVSKARGLTNLILGDASMDDVIKTTDIPNLYVLPCGPQPPNPAELLMTDRFKEVLKALESRFDRILLDSPPVLAVTDAVVLSRISDGVMLIAQAGKTQREDIAAAARQFRDVDASILGVILNDMDISQRRYGYYYYYYGGYESAPQPAKSEA